MQTLQPQTTLQSGKYKIIRVLGQGGFGITYLAEQVMLGRKVAIKEFFMKEYCDRDESTSRVTMGTNGSRDSVNRYKDKFLKEARNIAKLNHPNIVKIIDVFEENGTAYYVMEYVDGGSLAEKIKREGYMSEPVATRYILQVAEALAYVHERRMNHLDVKPDNIMLTETDTAVLIDFGLSKQYDIDGKQTSTTPVGISEGYAPMEQYKQGGVGDFSPETDIYALGATFFKMLTGTTPPCASDVNEEGVPVDELKAKGVSEKVIKVICEAMEPRKKDRMKDVKIFLKKLSGSSPMPSQTKETEEDTCILAESTELLNDGEVAQNCESMSANEYGKDKGMPTSYSNYSKKKSSANLKKSLVVISCLAIIAISVVWGVLATAEDDFWVVPCQYDMAGYFSEGLAAVCKDGEWGYIDQEGNVKIPFRYDCAWEFSEGLARVEKGTEYGYIDKRGYEVISIQYDFSLDFSEGLAMVVKDGKYGYINSHGETVIPCRYPYDPDDVQFYDFHEGLVIVKNDNKYGYIDKTGKERIPCRYDWVGDFSEGLAWVMNDEKYGYIDKNGNEVIPCQYDFARDFSEGLAMVDKSGKCGFVDKNGNVSIPFQYDASGLSSSFSDGLAVVSKEKKLGCIDKNSNQIIPFTYDFINQFSEGLAVVRKDEKCGVLDKNGNEVIPCIYDDVFDFSEGMAMVVKDGKCGFIKKP